MCKLVWGNIWRNDITQFMSGVKELALILCIMWCLQLINQLNRFLALQALVERLGICIATLGLNFPILLNWVKFWPGIWGGGATSSTGRGAADNSPTLGCFGLAPSRLSKQWGMDILPIFLLRLGSSRLMWITSLASLVTWEGSLSIMLKSLIEGRGWWKSLQCFSMAVWPKCHVFKIFHIYVSNYWRTWRTCQQSTESQLTQTDIWTSTPVTLSRPKELW